MAGTAVQVCRDNGLSSKTAALGGVNFKMATKAATGGFTKMRNDTAGDLTLVTFNSKDVAMGQPPQTIKANDTITINRMKTVGTGVVYRITNPTGVGFDWVLAWADKPEATALVYVTIHDKRDGYTEAWWNDFYREKVDKGTSESSAAYMTYMAEANIKNDANGESVINAKITK